MATPASPPLRPPPAPIPYAPIERHAVIGDRRTAALVAADGTIDWLCLPAYDGEPILGALLDATRGGHARFGPWHPAWGVQTYVDRTAVLETRFASGVVLTDAMVLPEGRSDASPRVVVRRLFARGGDTRCLLDARPRRPGLRVWSSKGEVRGEALAFDLRAGDEAWAVLDDGSGGEWSIDRARAALEGTAERWRRWVDRLEAKGPRAASIVRSLLTIRLLGHAPSGSIVAAPTTSLPERIGGDWNADYRLSWVRDGSLSIAALAAHGDATTAREYMDWIAGLGSSTDAPLQVVYGIDGRTTIPQVDRDDFAGYRESRPVRFGNHAYDQRQLGAIGYFVDGAKTYFDHGGPWDEAYFDLVARVADHAAATWMEADNGVWELSERRHHVSSRVMSWVALDRASALARALGCERRARRWVEERDAIRREVLTRGYSERLGAFRCAYDAEDALDASTLLIPLMGLLPADDPRVRSTVDRIASALTIEGHVYRFEPKAIPGLRPFPLGELEGSFLLCTCWLAAAYAMAGRLALAEETLARVEQRMGTTGLLGEGVDARTMELRGNFPLLFSHAEYLRAVRAIDAANQPPGGPEL